MPDTFMHSYCYYWPLIHRAELSSGWLTLERLARDEPPRFLICKVGVRIAQLPGRAVVSIG